MSHITVDDALLSQLQAIRDPVEVRDAKGRLLGHYRPLRTPAEVERYERNKQLFDLEEAERVAASERGQGCTTEELLRYLQSLDTKG